MCNKEDQSKINIVEMDSEKNRGCLELDVETVENSRLGHLLNGLVVPPVPPRLVSRVMEEAKHRVVIKQPVRPQPWWRENYWAARYRPTSIAACLAVVSACTLGLTLTNGIGKTDRGEPIIASTTVLNGLEWLGAATPGAVTSVYVTMK